MKDKINNQVVSDDFRKSRNFYHSDLILKEYLENNLDKRSLSKLEPFLQSTGEHAATVMDELSMKADKHSPVLKKRDFFGNDIDEVEFHPAYQELLKIAVDSGMFSLKWDNDFDQNNTSRHRMGFATGYLYAMSETGQYCPLCMTDGVARLIDLHLDDDTKKRLLPHIGTTDVNELYTGAMFLTEKSGGSDVGRNIVKAKKVEGDRYELFGEKWFCSNVNAELIFALARTDESIKGTKGLSIFLIEKNKKDGSRNPLPIVRLKDKLGVRSMASAECVLNGTEARLVGEEFKGFKIMTDMINLSRLYNAVAAISCARRALIEAFTFNSYRTSFNNTALDHALIRDKFWELGALHVAGFYLTWNTIEMLDKADNGDAKAKELNRLLTPMTKKWTAEKGVYIVRESMELMGGIGYIEDGVMPKIMRDVMVLPIWEGAGNIMTLDMLRATFKSDGLKIMLKFIKGTANKNEEYCDFILKQSDRLEKSIQAIYTKEQEEMELAAKYLFESLTTIYQFCLLIDERRESSKPWIDPSLNYLKRMIEHKEPEECISLEEIKGLIGWEI
tara:strand:+ start:24480 stop:26159 length:1680 start_codon:yes stop_codon:yes gene_type:complete